MDVNPYETPAAAADDAEPITATGESKPPPSRWEMVLFGTMVGIKFHAPTAALLSVVLGLIYYLGVLATTAVQFSIGLLIFGISTLIMGLTVGVVTGTLLGGVSAAFYGLAPRSRRCRTLACTISRIGHLLLGLVTGAAASGPLLFLLIANGHSERSLAYVGNLLLLAGLCFGWIVGGVVDRRIRSTFVSIYRPLADDKQPANSIE